MYPALDDLLNKATNLYYEAEFDGDQDEMLRLSVLIKSIKTKIELGEKYEVPF